eukprot:365636-Chlamydomonas_euryale.AAC.16
MFIVGCIQTASPTRHLNRPKFTPTSVWSGRSSYLAGPHPVSIASGSPFSTVYHRMAPAHPSCLALWALHVADVCNMYGEREHVDRNED